jgi:hypothetical protein
MVDNGGTVYQYLFQYIPKWIDAQLMGDYHTFELEYINPFIPSAFVMLSTHTHVRDMMVMYAFATQ